MSATGRSNVRQADDFYATPAWATRAILPYLRDLPQHRVLDPCCGTGAILDVVREVGADTWGIELNAGRAEEAVRKGHRVEVGDALAMDWPTALAGVVTNPPYSLAQRFIEESFGAQRRSAGCEAAFLLRLNFLGSDKRAKFHIAHPADIFVLSKRPEFVMSVKCSQRKKYGCTYEEILPIEAPRPEGCPLCGFPVTISTTDATEYAWFLYGPGRGGRLAILDVGEG